MKKIIKYLILSVLTLCVEACGNQSEQVQLSTVEEPYEILIKDLDGDGVKDTVTISKFRNGTNDYGDPIILDLISCKLSSKKFVPIEKKYDSYEASFSKKGTWSINYALKGATYVPQITESFEYDPIAKNMKKVFDETIWTYGNYDEVAMAQNYYRGFYHHHSDEDEEGDEFWLRLCIPLPINNVGEAEQEGNLDEVLSPSHLNYRGEDGRAKFCYFNDTTNLMPIYLDDIETDNNIIHKVKSGETIYGISKIYGIKQEKIIENNPVLKNSILETGQKIILK
jgi:hypothetical protein